jgi:iron complex outermembrane recepter protein
MLKPTPSALYSSRFSVVALTVLSVSLYSHAEHLEEVMVWGSRTGQQPASTGNSSVLHPQDLASVNIATTEDMVKFEPGIVIRRRFIGDANGTLGLRGSNMFQTSRSMVFADGVPLHYLLESRWNGAPRWTMVSASEIARVDILYGPFSAEYSGNSMGGVVLIESAIPQEREFHVDGSFFSQQFDEYGFDDNVDGYKGFVSYGDKLGELSYYASFNRLENQSHPQSFYYGVPSSGTATAVQGAMTENDERGITRLFFGDTGIIDTATDNLKFKVGYEFDHWTALVNIAYENRNSVSNSPNSYMMDDNGTPIWGGNVSQNGETIFIPPNRLNVSEQDRQSLSSGLRLRREVNKSVSLEVNLSQFTIIEDETRSSALNPNHPDYTPTGQILDYDDTGWQTAELKLRATGVGAENLDVSTGVRYEIYELNTRIYHSANYLTGERSASTSASGGESSVAAAFAQLDWKLAAQWRVSLGARLESWDSADGYFTTINPAADGIEQVKVPERSKTTVSPKFSVRYEPAPEWSLQYSAAKAYRFPIVEELFTQYQAYNAVSEANPTLQPENGLHHNLTLERAIDGGYVRLNVFAENIRDVIESQATLLPGGTSIRTFVPIDEVETRGVELILNAEQWLFDPLDIRMNLAWTDAEIVKNAADPSIIGNTFPRMPHWRSNVLANWRLGDRWYIGGNIQYASDSYGRLDNTDDEDNVFGAQDAYTRIGLKTAYRYSPQTSISLGVDNVTNETAYVAHPWPGRTFYLSLSYDL